MAKYYLQTLSYNSARLQTNVFRLIGRHFILITSPLFHCSASYVVFAGLVLGKAKLYMVTTFCSYPLSLIATLVSLYFMQVAQPALLYIVPIMMLSIVVTAACAGDLKTLWKFDMMMVSIAVYVG